MRKSTASKLVTMHNRVCRLCNLIEAVDSWEVEDDFTEKEKKELKKIREKASDLLYDIADFKIKALSDRGLPIPDVY